MVGDGRSGQSTHVCFPPVLVQITPVSVKSTSSAYTCQAKRTMAQTWHLGAQALEHRTPALHLVDDVEGTGRQAAGRNGQPTSRVPTPLPYMW